jgi:hypothetical protein
MIKFDENIPKTQPGLWGLKVNGNPVSEVIWSAKKPLLGNFTSVRPKALEDNPFPDIISLEVIRVDVVEIGSPELLSKSWNTD